MTVLTFAPPVRNEVPPTLEEDHPGNRLMRFFRARPAGVNVYLYKAGSLSANAHGRVDETDPIALYDHNGVVTTNGWEDIELVFWGGHEAVVVTAAQAAALQAAGYTVTTTVVPAAPTITSISPTSGVEGTTVTLIGTGLNTTTSITVGGVSALYEGNPDGTLLGFITPTHADGAVDVVVTTPLGVAQTTFTYATPAVDAPPAITALAPATGFAGTQVAITGTNLGVVSSVTFGGASAAFTVNSATSITATVPSHADGTLSVVATDVNGASNSFDFVYATPAAPTITSLSPTSGVATTLVSINGTGLDSTTSVTVDGVTVSATIVSASLVRFTAPAHSDAAVTVVLTTPYGSANSTFTYSTPVVGSPPDLTSVTPNSGSIGTAVTLVGTSLDGAISVTFGGVAAGFNVSGTTQITTTAPTHADGAVAVMVTTSFGNDTIIYTYTTVVADPHPGSDILLEDNTFLLLEDGTSSLLQE